jgi:Ca2+-transporting ATPase
MAVSIVVMVSSLNDYQKEKQFRKLNARKEDRKVKVIRDGQQVQISVFDLQVGDIMTVEPGDLISVDGVLVTSHNLKADESSATGESDLIKKQAYGPDCVDPFMISGSKINEGATANLNEF